LSIPLDTSPPCGIIVVVFHISINPRRRMDRPFDSFVDILEAGQRLNIHPESVRRLIRQGRLPAYKFANKWLIERDVLEQFAQTYDGRPGAKARLL
jgi:excisionase family DNA binding protein